MQCRIVGCVNKQYKKNRDFGRPNKSDLISFHRFPKDAPTCNAWISVCGRDPAWRPCAQDVICSKHFEPKCYRKTSHRKRLKPPSVPKLFIHSKNDNQPVSEKGTIQVRKDLIYEFSEDSSEKQSPTVRYLPLSKGIIIDANLWDSFEENIQSIKAEENSSRETSELLDNDHNDIIDNNNEDDDNNEEYNDSDDNDINDDDDDDSDDNMSYTETKNYQEGNKSDTDTASETSLRNVNKPLSSVEVSTACRLCLRGRGSFDMTAPLEGPKTLAEVLLDCFKITLSCMSEAGRSRLACSECAASLQRASAFKRRVLLAEHVFAEHCRQPQADDSFKLDNDQIFDQLVLEERLREGIEKLKQSSVIHSKSEFLYQWLCIISEHNYSEFVPKNLSADHSKAGTELRMKMQSKELRKQIFALEDDSATTTNNATTVEKIDDATVTNNNSVNTSVDTVGNTIDDLIASALNSKLNTKGMTELQSVKHRGRRKSTFKNIGDATVTNTNAVDASVDTVANTIDDMTANDVAAKLRRKGNTEVKCLEHKRRRKSTVENIGIGTFTNTNAADATVNVFANTINGVVSKLCTKENTEVKCVEHRRRRKSTFKNISDATVTNINAVDTTVDTVANTISVVTANAVAAKLRTKGNTEVQCLRNRTRRKSSLKDNDVTNTKVNMSSNNNSGTFENIGVTDASLNTNAVDFEDPTIVRPHVINKNAAKFRNSNTHLITITSGATLPKSKTETFESKHSSKPAVVAHKRNHKEKHQKSNDDRLYTNTHTVAITSGATDLNESKTASIENANAATFANTNSSNCENTNSAVIENNHAAEMLKCTEAFVNTKKKRKIKRCYFNSRKKIRIKNRNSPIITNIYRIDAQNFDMLPNDEHVETQMTDNLEILENDNANDLDMMNDKNTDAQISKNIKMHKIYPKAFSILRNNVNNFELVENDENSNKHLSGDAHIHTKETTDLDNMNDDKQTQSYYSQIFGNFIIANNETSNLHGNCNIEMISNQNDEYNDTQFTNNINGNSLKSNENYLRHEIQNCRDYSEKDIDAYKHFFSVTTNDTQNLDILANEDKISGMFSNGCEKFMPIKSDIDSDASFLVKVPINKCVIKNEYEDVEIKDEFECYRKEFDECPL